MEELKERMENLVNEIYCAISKKQKEAFQLILKKHPKIRDKNLVVFKMSIATNINGDRYSQFDYEVEYNGVIIDRFNIIVDYRSDNIIVSLNF